MVDVIALAQAVQRELASDNLDDLSVAMARKLICSFARIEGGGVEYRAFDEFVSFESGIRLLYDAVIHVGLADDDRGLEMMGDAA